MRSGSAYDAFLDHQNANNKIVKISGPNRALTQCPGPNHENQDHNPSLSVARGQGRVLLYCFAHCTAEMITDAMGWTMQDLFDDPGGVAYRYDEGRVVHRKPNKTFSQSGHTNGEVTTLYRLGKISSAPPEEIVFLVEGEQDVETIETLGLIATSAPMGAANFNRVDATPLYGRKIIAIVDKDQKGEEWAQQVRQKLDGMPDLLEFKQAKVGKDASDHITALGSLEDLEDFSFPRSERLAGLRNAGWLEAQIFPDLRWMVPDLIPEGFTILAGAPKAGKSYLALGMALACASGGRAFGKLQVDQRPVLMIALEDSDRRMKRRIGELLAPGDRYPVQLDYLTAIDQGQVIMTIMDWIDTLRHGVQPLIIIDTIGKIMPRALPGETTYDRDYKLSSWLHGICRKRPGMGLIGLHHSRKAASEDFVDVISGTQGLGAGADTLLILAKKRGEEKGLLKITSRERDEDEYAIHRDDYGWSLTGKDLVEAAINARTFKETDHLKDDSLAILNTVNTTNRPITAQEIAQRLGLDRAKVTTYLTRLFDSGKIAKQGRGLYTPVTSVISTPLNNTHNNGTVSPLHEGRCEECRWHVETQGHRADCSRFNGAPE